MNRVWWAVIIIVIIAIISGLWWFASNRQAESDEDQVIRTETEPALTRNQPEVIKGVLDHGGENLRELVATEKANIEALGANTIYVYLEHEYYDGRLVLNPLFRGPNATGTAEEQYKDLLREIKETGMAVHLAIAYGGGQNKPFGVPIERLLDDAEAADIKWAEIAEELKIESYAPSSEIDFQIFREYYGSDWSNQTKHDAAAVKSNEYHDRVLPKLRAVFNGKLIYQAGLYSKKLCSKGYDIFGTGLNSVGRDASNFDELAREVFGYAERNAKCSGSEWMLTEFWIPVKDNNGQPEGGKFMKTPSGTLYTEIQDDLYRIGADAYLNWNGEMRPVGFGFTSWQQSTAAIKGTVAAEIVKEFYAKL